LSNQQRFEVFQCANYGQFPAGESRLSNTIDAFICVDDEEEEIAVTAPDWESFNIGNFHDLSPVNGRPRKINSSRSVILSTSTRAGRYTVKD
jgi:hypothetical protein